MLESIEMTLSNFIILGLYFILTKAHSFKEEF